MDQAKRRKWLVYICLSSLMSTLAVQLKQPLLACGAFGFAIAALIISIKHKKPSNKGADHS